MHSVLESRSFTFRVEGGVLLVELDFLDESVPDFLHLHPRGQMQVVVFHFELIILLFPESVEERVFQGLINGESFSGIEDQGVVEEVFPFREAVVENFIHLLLLVLRE